VYMSLLDIFSRKGEKASLPITTDIHCHILPGVDDGSPDLSTSLRLLERMEEMGFRRIFASPHITEVTFENTPEILDDALEQLKTAAALQNSSVILERSSENRIDDFFRAQLAAGNIKPLPGNYLIVENSFVQEPWGLDQLLFDLKIEGFRPILAHPERYNYYYSKHLGRYEALHNAGTHFQINLLSLAGVYGKQEKKIAEALIEKGWVRFVGTDIHKPAHVDALEEYLTTRDARQHFKMLEGRLLNDSIPDPE
ncbi:MAG: hypothetical protein K2K55_07610, partial [Duncaniella sp.]|nr:hypothetical protein [Duncaniella sp.]